MNTINYISAPATTEKNSLTNLLLLIMSIAAGISVASLYYMQPLLAQIAAYYNISQTNAGLIVTLTQIGYALGMLLLLPLADILEKRRFIVIMSGFAGIALFTLYISPNLYLMTIAALFIGFTSVIPQLLIPLGAQLSKPQKRGNAIGSIMSGILIGILLSRVFSGYIAQFYNWKTIYIIAAFIMFILAVILHFTLPRSPALNKIKYSQSLLSIFTVIKNYPALRQASIIGAMAFFAFSIFWTTLTFHLHDYYQLNSSYAGLFGLIGVMGAISAPFFGRIADKKGTRFTVGSSILVIIISYFIFLLYGYTLWGLIIGLILLDIGVQCCNVSNQTRIHQLNENARSRITAVYMITFFVGGALGSFGGAWAYQHYSWTGSCLLALLTQIIALIRFIK